MVGVQKFESERNLVLLNILTPVCIKVIHFSLEVLHVYGTFSEKTLWGKLLNLLILQFFEEEVFFNVREMFMQVVW